MIAATSGRGGFTRGFAAVLRTSTGQQAFVKTARLRDQDHLADWYAREVAVAAALPAGVRAARPRWTMTAAGHFVVCLDPIDGHIPGLPWQPAELTAALDAWAAAAAALREPPAELLAVGLPRLSDLLRADLSHWQWIAAGQAPMPPAPPLAAAHLRDLVALEALLPGYVDTTAVTHCDLRIDNVLIDRAGEAWLCDWTWLCHGAPVVRHGGPADHGVRQRTGRGRALHRPPDRGGRPGRRAGRVPRHDRRLRALPGGGPDVHVIPTPRPPPLDRRDGPDLAGPPPPLVTPPLPLPCPPPPARSRPATPSASPGPV